MYEKLGIVYRDEIGYVVCELDTNGVSFCDGKAYFTDADGRDYKIPVERIMSIG